MKANRANQNSLFFRHFCVLKQASTKKKKIELDERENEQFIYSFIFFMQVRIKSLQSERRRPNGAADIRMKYEKGREAVEPTGTMYVCGFHSQKKKKIKKEPEINDIFEKSSLNASREI